MSARKFPCGHFSEGALFLLNPAYTTEVDTDVHTAQKNKTENTC